MADVVLRPYRPDDACAALARDRYVTLGRAQSRDVRNVLGDVPWDESSNVMLALEDGAPVAYAWLRNWVTLGYLEVWVALGHRRRTIGSQLVQWAVQEAKRQDLPELRCVTDNDAPTAAFLQQAGFVSTPSGIRMDLPADTSVADPVWPDGFEVRTEATKSDALVQLVWRIDQAGFADNANFGPQPVENFAKIVHRDDFDLDLAWFAFTPDGEDAAFCICTHVTDQGVGEIEDLAVLPAFRRRGLARALLRHGVRALRERGAATVVLDTGQDNERAQALYRSEGFVETFRYASWVRTV